ncbi:MAG TPA: hypothetical protein PKD60_07000 [Turneriella sp.]|nr:hypothetical protein [Turneriella sp.]
MKIISYLSAFMLLLFAAGCKSGQSQTWEGSVFTGQIDEQVDKLLGGRDIYADPQRVVPVLVNSEQDSGAKKENLEGYVIKRKGKLLSPEQIKKLQAVIFDANTYDFKHSKRCMFVPYIGFIFEKSGKQAHALFCFTCNEVSFGRGGAQGNLEDFDAKRREILQLARELFPDDERLAGLKEEGIGQ